MTHDEAMHDLVLTTGKVDLEEAARLFADMLDADGAVVFVVDAEQRQLEVALALAGRPRLLLLDEPTAGLSPAESQMMAALLRTLDPAITILIIEHDMDVAFGLADHVMVLHNGRVIADGSPEAVKADPLVAEIYLGTD